MTMIISGSDGLEFPDGSDQGTAFTGNAATITSGTIDTARLATGTANSSTYLRGDQTWAAVPAATPGGSTTQVQYNNAGAFGGDADFTFNGTTVTMANDASISGLTVGKGAGAGNNTTVGYQALATNTAGNAITAIGYQALNLNTANNQTAVGYKALATNSTGTLNTGIGGFSLYSTTTGSENTALGWASLYANISGSYNTAIGRDALQANTTASNNTAVGYQAGYTNTTNTAGVFLGYQAGYLATGNNNTFLGLQSGYRATGGNNTFVGVGSGGEVTSGAKNTIIGSYAGNQGGLDIRTGSNNIVLSDGDGNPRWRADSTGQEYTLIVGVGLYASYSCRVWVNFNGTGTPAIRGSGSASSITDNGTCSYTINFSITLPDTNYSINVSQNIESSGSTSQMMGVMTSSNSSYVNKSTTAVRIQGYNPVSSNFDPFEVDIAIFR